MTAKKLKILCKTKRGDEMKTSVVDFTHIVQKNRDGILIVDREGVIVFANQAAKSILGRGEGDLANESLGLPIEAGTKEINIIRADGQSGTGEMTIVPTVWKDKNAYLVMITDTIDSRTAEETIVETAQRWRATFDSITDMVSIHDENFKILRANKALAKAFHTEPKELIGKACYELFNCTEETYLTCPHIQTLRTKKPAMLEFYEPGMDTHLGISTFPILDDKNEITGVVHITKDITARKQTEETLKKANEKLTEYNRLKDEFVSTASHELRTPLSIIQGAIRLILDEILGKVVEEQKEILIMAMENVKRLGRIVDSLLNISRIESGKMELHKTIVDVCQLIRETVSDYTNLALEKSISLECLTPLRSVNVCLDPDKIKQVLVNLISNSLKFTPENGWIRIVCTDLNEHVQISVQDSGVGIAQHIMPKLFEKFTQFGENISPREKGTGLGLSIAKKLVEMHNGKIEVESEVGHGAVFTITLPFTSRPVLEAPF